VVAFVGLAVLQSTAVGLMVMVAVIAHGKRYFGCTGP